MERLNAELTDELAVKAVYPAESKFTEIAYAAYTYTLTLPEASEALAARIREVLADKELSFTKRTKSGEKIVNVSDLIHSATVCYEEGAIRIEAVLATGEGKTLTPEAIVTILRERLGLFGGNPLEERYRILRREIYLADATTPFC